MSIIRRLALSALSPMASSLCRLVRRLETQQSASAAYVSTAHPIAVDQVWSGFSDEGAEYWCLRLSKSDGSRHGCIRNIGSPPRDSSYRLVAAANYGLTLFPILPSQAVNSILPSVSQGVES